MSSSKKPNPNSRTPEFSNPMRRSFSGNPSIVKTSRSLNSSTTANSPSDFGRRNSIDRSENSFHIEEKENDKEHNLKPSKLRSPSPNFSKGSKHFMSPTISAVSKITAASPRKKILSERNWTSSVLISDKNPLSNSMNFSDFVDDSDSKSETFSNMKKIEPLIDSQEASLIEEVVDSKVPFCLNQKNIETLFDSQGTSVVGEVTNSKLPSNSTETESLISVITSTDLDQARFKISPTPSLSCFSCPNIAPLDADPSVRPPYDPKTNYLSPRPQFLHYKPKAYLNKESLLFESLSDNETTEIEESDDSSVEIVSEEEEEEDEHDVYIEAKAVPKAKHFCARLKFVSCFFIILVAVLSISLTDTPVNDETMNLGVLQFSNLTGLHEDFFLDGHRSIDIGYEMGHIKEVEVQINPVEEKGATEIGLYEDKIEIEEPVYSEIEKGLEIQEEVVEEPENISEEEDMLTEDRSDDIIISLQISPVSEIEEIANTKIENQEEVFEEPEKISEEEEKSDDIIISLQISPELEDQFSEILQQEEVPEGNNVGEHESNLFARVGTKSIQADKVHDITQSIETEFIKIEEVADISNSIIPSAWIVPGVSVLASLVVSVGVFLFVKHRKQSISSAAIAKNAAFASPKPHEVNMGSQVCPSEMSSFQKCSSYSKKSGKQNHEVQSLEKKMKSAKRESLESLSGFSIDSPSYGSFTTYEIIHRKHGDGEAVTPVRRSSRIRSSSITSS